MTTETQAVNNKKARKKCIYCNAVIEKGQGTYLVQDNDYTRLRIHKFCVDAAIKDKVIEVNPDYGLPVIYQQNS